ncbi:hypothetical protein [Amycolatopsis magusensis]|uniref:hypothetical protein n=1 Tax=Amycolatopsis magusensis TaxID=882444 RepID=UPI0037B592AE
MPRPLPSNDDVRRAMDQVLADARAAGRHPTVSAVERALDIRHATFYRNYRDLITGYFQPPGGRGRPRLCRTGAHRGGNAGRHRAENAEFRKLVQVYEEAIRQLTLTNNDLREKLNVAAKVTALPPRERRPDR